MLELFSIFISKNFQDPVMSFRAWDDMLSKELNKKDWKDNLHRTKVLLNFGATPEENQKVITIHLRKLEWLSKFLMAYKIKGCLTDIVNLVMAMMPHQTLPETEAEVVSLVSKFTEKLRKSDISDLWIPDLIVHDAEMDDMFCWAILRAVKMIQKEAHLTIVVQLHPNVPDEILFHIKSLLRYRHNNPKNQVFADGDSKNLLAILNNFQHVLNK
jgi:hypothetical protein